MRGLQDREEPIVGWRSLVRTATIALAESNAERLEQLSDSCLAFGNRAILAQDIGELKREMTIFRGVLEATRANLEIMYRLRAIREKFEYREQAAHGCGIEGDYGNH